MRGGNPPTKVRLARYRARSSEDLKTAIVESLKEKKASRGERSGMSTKLRTRDKALGSFSPL